MPSTPKYPHLIRKEPQLKRLLSKAENSEEVRSVMRKWAGKQEVLIPTVSTHARYFDKEILFTLLNSGISLHTLVENRHFPDEWDEEIADWMKNRIIGEIKGDYLYPASATLSAIAAKETVPFEHQIFEDLMELATIKEHPSERHQVAIDVLLDHPQITVSALDTLHPFIRNVNSFGALIKLATHKRVHPETRDKIIKEQLQASFVSRPVMEQLLSEDEIRLDEEYRPLLVAAAMKSHDYSAGATLLMDVKSKEEVKKLWGFVLKDRDFYSPLIVLDRKGSEIAKFLSTEDLAPLLKSPKRETRATAIAIMGMIEGRGGTEGQKVETKKSKKRG